MQLTGTRREGVENGALLQVQKTRVVAQQYDELPIDPDDILSAIYSRKNRIDDGYTVWRKNTSGAW